MGRLLKEYTFIIYSVILLIYIFNTFLSSFVLTYIVGVLTIPMIFLSFYGANKLFKVLSSIFIGVGLIFFIYTGLPLYEIPLYTISTMPLLAFLLVLPWMNSVVRAGRFDRRINEVMKVNVDDLGKLYVRSSFTTYILTTFISLSAIFLSQKVLLENMSKMEKKVRNSFIGQSTMRAFSLALIWSPMEMIVAITVDSTGVSYLTYLPWLFLCSILILILDWIMNKNKFKTIPYVPASEGLNRPLNPKKITVQIVKLFIALTFFLMVVVSLGNHFHLNFILSVTLVILPFSIVWALLMKRWRSFLAVGWGTWKAHTNNLHNLVTLFLSLAFFSSSLNETPFLQLIQQPFIVSSEKPLVILLLIQLAYFMMSMIGVHPVATIAVLLEILHPLFDFINPLSIGIVLITTGLATATVGPYGVIVTITSMSTKQNPYKITTENIPFALIYGSIGVFIGFLLL
ncbi:hypothetical protein [Alkalihalobacterium elongatum]|uniref:hypothetical protein n=1 Tax=Alkalihalobacterium elongatum TaxID=2675466 RepID=UPI001C1F7895|nr:hypothetical protein [Alkalihalobacterium elongatum]